MSYVTIDIINDTDNNMVCDKEFTFNGSLLQDKTNEYTVTLARADYGLRGMPIFNLKNNINYQIRNNLGSITKHCIFKSGYYYSIQEIIDEVNSQTTSVGEFNYNNQTSLLEYKMFNGSEHLFIIFPSRLKKLFDGFDYDKNGNSYDLHEKSETFVSQQFSTTERFYNMKAVRIYAELGQKETVECSNLYQTKSSYLLSDQAIIASDALNRLIYVPSQFRKIDLKSAAEIKKINIRIEIEYANLERTPLILSPGTYFSCLLMFEKKINNE